jgi:gliding-associated putative ABC transporter substrate-binding component GldG
MKNLHKRNGWIIALIVLIAVNFIAAQVHPRVDLTEEKRYSLSQPTKALLRDLDDKITIDILLAGNELPAVVRRFQSSLEDFLAETREVSRNNIEYHFLNPYGTVVDTAQERRLEDSLYYSYGLYPSVLDAPQKAGDKLEVVKLIHGAILRYKDTAIGINFLQGVKTFGTGDEERKQFYNEISSKLEYKFASALQKLTRSEKPAVAYALGHGEAWGYNVDDAVRTLITDYQFDTVNIKSVPFIPSELDAIVILKPTQPFTDADKLKIDQYVVNGGKVFWMVDNMYAEFDSLYKSQGFIAFDRGLNLEDLLFNYGVRLNQTLLQDMQCDKLPQVGGEGQQPRLVDWPFFPVLNGTEHPISKNLDGVRTFFPTTLDTVAARGITKTALLLSSNNARLLNAPTKIDFGFLQIAPDVALFQQKAVPVAFLLEGAFRSLYTGRLPKATADSLNKINRPFIAISGSAGKMIVVSDGDIALNQFSPSEGPLPMGENVFTRYTFANKDFFTNCLEYLVNPTDILQTRSKEYSLRLLDPKKTETQKTEWQLINIALPIFLVVLAGVVYQQLRRRRFAG